MAVTLADPDLTATRAIGAIEPRARVLFHVRGTGRLPRQIHPGDGCRMKFNKLLSRVSAQ